MNLFNKDGRFIKANLYQVTILIFSVGTVLFGMAVYNNFYIIFLNSDTSKTILSTLIEVCGSITGFLVIYLSISFENLKRNFGKYAMEIFRKDTLVWSMGYMFIVIILIGLLAFLFIDEKNHFAELLFNLTCFYFFGAIALLFPVGNAIFNKSSSRHALKKLIDDLTEQDFADEPPRNFRGESIFRIVNATDTNKVNIISDILYHNINGDNNKTSILILIHFFDKVKTLATGMESAYDVKRRVIFASLHILQTSFDLYHGKKDFTGIQTVLAGLNSCNSIIAENKLGKEYIDKVFDVIVYISQSLIESANERFITEALWTYYHMSNAQLTHNIPDEKETWEQDENDLTTTINTSIAWENDSKFEAIDHAVTFQFNQVLERSFFCSNYYIVEECVRMYSVFTEMIVFNRTLGPLQKDRIGSMLAYYSAEGIKRLIGKQSRQFDLLHFYMGTSNILNALEQNSRFSQSVFDYFIEIFDYLIEHGKVGKYDLEKLGGLCRLVIAYSEKIHNPDKYAEEILRVQQKLKSRCFKEIIASRSNHEVTKKQKETVNLIQKDTKSYLEIMLRKNITNEKLKATITKYL